MSKSLPLFLAFGVAMAVAMAAVPAHAADKPSTPRGIAPPTRIPDVVAAAACG